MVEAFPICHSGLFDSFTLAVENTNWCAAIKLLEMCICTQTHTDTDGTDLDVLCLVAQLCPILCNPMDCSPPSSYVHGDSPGKNTRVGCLFLLQGVFPTQESNLGLLHCRHIVYHLSLQGSPQTYINGHKNTIVSCIQPGLVICFTLDNIRFDAVLLKHPTLAFSHRV